MIQREHLTGLVLAGGRASRMQPSAAGRAALRPPARHGPRGGGHAGAILPEGGAAPIEKGLVLFRGEPLVAHARRFLAGQVSRVVISANRQIEAYAQYGDVFADAPEVGPEAGPLAGVYSALTRIATPWLAVTPVDVLDLPPDLIPRLSDALARTAARAAYATTTRSHPLCMMVHKELAPSLRDYLLAGDRKVMLWLDSVGAVPALFDQGGQAFANINTLDDLQRAELASAGAAGPV